MYISEVCLYIVNNKSNFIFTSYFVHHNELSYIILSFLTYIVALEVLNSSFVIMINYFIITKNYGLHFEDNFRKKKRIPPNG